MNSLIRAFILLQRESRHGHRGIERAVAWFRGREVTVPLACSQYGRVRSCATATLMKRRCFSFGE